MFPLITVASAASPLSSMPSELFPEMTFLAPAAPPPITVDGASKMLMPSNPFPNAAFPDEVVPIRLPWIVFADVVLVNIWIPYVPFPEIRLPAPGAVPPMVFPFAPPCSVTPTTFGSACVPFAFVPM